jgi:hypothetical protein
MFLGACLESLIDNVDGIIVADGAYHRYYEHYKAFDPQAQPWSTDGTIEIIENFTGKPSTRIIRQPEGELWENQIKKRTALVEAVPDGDSFIIIDADEMVAGDFQEAVEQWYDSGCVCSSTPIYSPGTHFERVTPRWHPRLFEKMEGMHYRGTHWHLRDRFGRIIEEKYPQFWTDLMAIVHFKPFKTKARLIPHANYMGELAQQGWLEPTDLGNVLMRKDP